MNSRRHPLLDIVRLLARRARHGPLAVFGGCTGAIHANAYPGYDPLFLPNGATEVACWAHARRRFVEAEVSESELAKETVNRIRELYAVGQVAKEKELDGEARRELRQEHAVPTADEPFAWMAARQAEVLPRGSLERSLSYPRKLEPALRRYLENGRLSIDYNAAERAPRAVAVVRRNWLFL